MKLSLHKRDICFALIGALVAGIAVTCCYEARLRFLVSWCNALELKGQTKLLPTVRATRDIPAGSVITLDQMKTTYEFDEMHLPANPLNNPWIGVNRVARRTIRKEEFVDYSDVFPRNLLP